MIAAKKLALAALLALGMTALATADDGNPIIVKAVPWERVAVNPEVSAPATVVSLGNSRIGAEISARVADIPVRVGDIVAPGGILVQLDCGDYTLAVAELEAQLSGTDARIRFAREQLRRAQSLKRQRTISEELFDEREATLAGLVAEQDMQRARLGMAKRNVSKCLLRAPFKAVVVERLASAGEYAMPGSPLVRVLDIDKLEVSADVIVGDAPGLLDSGRIVFRSGGQEYPVALRTLTPVIDPLARTREARLLFLAESALVGASGRLIWRMGVVLPADLLVRRQQRLGVLLAEGGKARFYPIPGAQEGRPAPADLPAGAMIITDGRFALEDGDAIRVTD